MMKNLLLPKMQRCICCTLLLMLTIQQYHSCIKNIYQIDLWRTKCLNGYTGDFVKMVHLSPALTEDVDRILYDTTDERNHFEPSGVKTLHKYKRSCIPCTCESPQCLECVKLLNSAAILYTEDPSFGNGWLPHKIF